MKKYTLGFIFALISINSVQAQMATAVLSLYSEHTKQQLLRCDDTAFESGFYGNYYGVEFHGSTNMCGGDVLSDGEVSLYVNSLFASTRLKIKLEGAGPDPFILYEVYWIPAGGNPVDPSASVPSDPTDVGDRVFIGNIMTDCNHDADDYVRVLNGAADLVSPLPSAANPKALIGASKFTGHWLLYSRGTQGTYSGGACDAASNVTKSVFSPQLWGGATNKFDGVQFISGHSIPAATISGPVEWMDIYNLYNP